MLVAFQEDFCNSFITFWENTYSAGAQRDLRYIREGIRLDLSEMFNGLEMIDYDTFAMIYGKNTADEVVACLGNLDKMAEGVWFGTHWHNGLGHKGNSQK